MKCRHCGAEHERLFGPHRPDPLDKDIREATEIEWLRDLLIIRSTEMYKARAQVEVLRSIVEDRAVKYDD